jgi:uncharacterized membrane protein YebE (DUF533 family)
MSLGKTLLKVAIGVLVAKGVSSLTMGSAGGTTSAGRGTRIDRSKTGGLEDMMGDVLGSGRPPRQTSGRARTPDGQGGGLGDLLDQLSGQKRASPRASAPKGGLDDLLGQLTGKQSSGTAGRASGGVGDLLDQVLADKPGGQGRGPLTLPEPDREETLSAALMLRAVIQAVKCDGALDDAERDRLTDAMGSASQREIQAVQAELSRPVDVQGLARAVPAGLEPQVYMASLMAMDLDARSEADYLHQLALALDLSPDEINAMHDKAGAPRLYR